MIPPGTLGYLVGLVEDVGEMVVLSVAVWYAYGLLHSAPETAAAA